MRKLKLDSERKSTLLGFLDQFFNQDVMLIDGKIISFVSILSLSAQTLLTIRTLIFNNFNDFTPKPRFLSLSKKYSFGYILIFHFSQRAPTPNKF